MQVLSRVLLLIGVLVLLAGLGLFVYSQFEVWKQWIAVSASRSRDFLNPIPRSALGVTLLTVGAFLAGLGLNQRR